MSEHRRSRRLKSFLGSFAYFDKRRGVMSCLVRDFSDEGARIIFSETVTIPDVVNLHLPTKNITLKAKVTWRRGDEIGLGFNGASASTATEPPADAAELMKRVAQLETEIASLRKALRRMKAALPPHHGDDAAA